MPDPREDGACPKGRPRGAWTGLFLAFRYESMRIHRVFSPQPLPCPLLWEVLMELTCQEHVESQAPKGGAWHSPEEKTTAQVRVRNVGMSHLQARCSWAFLAVVQRTVCGCPGRTVVLRMLTWKVNGTSQTPPICFHSGLATVVRIFDEKAAGGGRGQSSSTCLWSLPLPVASVLPATACGFRWPLLSLPHVPLSPPACPGP